LLETYPSAGEYLQDPFYLIQHSWAHAYTSRFFTAGMQSTQRVELINAIIHKAVSSSSTMSDIEQNKSCENSTNLTLADNSESIEDIENYYDYRQIYL
ncbi:10637_t:CDS:2, partial [Racocetra fulgida]